MAGQLLPILFGVAASVSTLLGGLLAMRLGSRIHLVLGLTAGIVLGVAFFDLVPEALELGADSYEVRTVLAALAAGFAGYMVIDRLLAGHDAHSVMRARLGPISLTLHSLLDGLGIGLAFQISPAIGGVIAFAVLTHDLADGVNIVGLCLAGSRRMDARRWLAINAAAPLAGVIGAGFIRLPAPALALLLAVFAGVFLYIGACELVPRSYGASPRPWTTAATLFGMLLMCAVVSLG